MHVIAGMYPLCMVFNTIVHDDPQAFFAYGLQVRAPGDQADILTRQGQSGSQETADGSGTDNTNLHTASRQKTHPAIAGKSFNKYYEIMMESKILIRFVNIEN